MALIQLLMSPLMDMNLFTHLLKLDVERTGLYIKNGYDYEVITEFSKSEENIFESIFIELKRLNRKNLIVGCFYRHHSSPELFIDNFLKKTIDNISKKQNKLCAIMGDFNIDLLKYDSENSSSDFYDLISSYGYRPLIMQPTRVTSHSATLIDNIFINDLETQSIGGNITASVSDHFPQFSQINIFDKPLKKSNVKYGRSFKHFNQNEFATELQNINWSHILNGNSTDESFNKFFLIIEHLLNEMAPLRKLTKKEIGLQKLPWITNGLLISMADRDKTYRLFLKEKNLINKNELFSLYKRKRNMVISLIRRSKKDYYNKYFEENKSNVKKTWEGIRNIVNISKKSKIVPTKLIYNNEIKYTNVDMSESMNSFFVNIGNMVENKIPNGDTHYKNYLKNPNINNIFLKPVDKNEILYLVNQINSTKACGPNSIPTNILKNNIVNLSEPLEMILNMSLNEGVFPKLMKFANVCQFLKKVIKINVKTTDQFPYFQTSARYLNG